VDRPMARRKGVRVIPARMLAGYLTRARPTTLSEQEIEQVEGRLEAALLDHEAGCAASV